MTAINLGDLPSWIMALLIGIGILAGISNDLLNPSYTFGSLSLPVGQLGVLIIGGAVCLGGFYFLIDILNKL